jgi:hypothetical protein
MLLTLGCSSHFLDQITLPFVSQLETCLLHLYQWLCQNGLCLNPAKFDAIVFGTSKQLAALPEIALLCVTVTDVTLSNNIRTLSVMLDSCLSSNNHVSVVCVLCLYHIKVLCHIWASLTTDVSITLATALVQSRLDYSNSILYNTATTNLHKLQRIQNALAKAIFITYFRISALELLHNLHWLPVNKRIDPKLQLLPVSYSLESILPTFAIYLSSGNRTEAYDLLTKTISISFKQKQNLGLGPFHLLLQKFGIHFLRFALFTLNLIFPF